MCLSVSNTENCWRRRNGKSHTQCVIVRKFELVHREHLEYKDYDEKDQGILTSHLTKMQAHFLKFQSFLKTF